MDASVATRPFTKKEIFAHLLDLKACADRNNKEEFVALARRIIIPHSPELRELYEYSKAQGFIKKEKLRKNFSRKVEATEELIDVAYICFQSGNFNPLFAYLPRIGV